MFYYAQPVWHHLVALVLYLKFYLDRVYLLMWIPGRPLGFWPKKLLKSDPAMIVHSQNPVFFPTIINVRIMSENIVIVNVPLYGPDGGPLWLVHSSQGRMQDTCICMCTSLYTTNRLILTSFYFVVESGESTDSAVTCRLAWSAGLTYLIWLLA